MKIKSMRIKNLFQTVTESTSFLQASGETDFDFFYSVYKILVTLTTEDWDYLKKELPKWSEDQLDVLVTTLYNTHRHYEKIEDNFFIGYIFTIAPENLASSIFDSYLYYFILENKVESIELLNSIENKVNELYNKKYIKESEYAFSINYIEEAKKKAF